MCGLRSLLTMSAVPSTEFLRLAQKYEKCLVFRNFWERRVLSFVSVILAMLKFSLRQYSSQSCLLVSMLKPCTLWVTILRLRLELVFEDRLVCDFNGVL